MQPFECEYDDGGVEQGLVRAEVDLDDVRNTRVRRLLILGCEVGVGTLIIHRDSS